MRTIVRSFASVLLLSLVCILALTNIALAQKKITWTGGANTNNWEDAANWSPSSVPGASDTVYIPAKIGNNNVGVVNINSNISVARLTVNNQTLNIESGSLTYTSDASISANTTIYVGGNYYGPTHPATLTNAKSSLCSYLGKTITIYTGSKFINNGTWQVISATNPSTFTYGKGLFINNGYLRTGDTNKVEVDIANDTLIDNGEIENRYGSLWLNCNGIFKNAKFTATDSAVIKMTYKNYQVKDTLHLQELTGGIINITSGTMTTDSITVLAPYNHPEVNSRSFLKLFGANLEGTGKWINDASLILGNNGNCVLGNLVNRDSLLVTSYSSQLLARDTLWNKGIINFQSNGSMNNADRYHPGVIINDSLIESTLSASNISYTINPTLYNNSTLWAKNGSFNMSDTLYEHNGRWMSDANAVLSVNDSGIMYLSGTITGQSQGTISLNNQIYADTLQNVILNIGGNGATMWTGAIDGPGELTNKGVFAIKAGMSIGIKTHFSNAGDMTIANVGQSMAVDPSGRGYISNSGTLHLRDRSDIRGQTKLFGKAMVVNTGTIVKDGDSGTASIDGLLDNSGKIEAIRGKLILNNNWERNATFAVADTAEIDLDNTTRVHGSVGGKISGKLIASGSYSILSADTLQTSTVNFTGIGAYINGFKGPGRWINSGIIHGSNYQSFNEALTNTGTIYFNNTTQFAAGDTLYNDGHIILEMETLGQVTGPNNSPSPMIVNRGVIQDDGQSGYEYFNIPVINQDTVRIDAGRLTVTNSFDNQASGVITGLNGVFEEINNRPYLSNEGGIYPYGPTARFTIQGPLDLSSPTSYIKIDIGGDQLNGNLRVTNTFTGGQGTIHIRATGSFLPQDQSNYDILHAPSGLPSPLPTVVSDINYVHFTETVQDTVLQLTAHRDLASIGKISRDTVNAGLIAPLTIKGSGFNSHSHFWISEHLPSKPDSVVTEDLITDSLFSDHVNVSMDLREPWWMGKAYIHTQNPGQPADSTSIFIIPVLSIHFKRFVGRQGVGIINTTSSTNYGRSWTTTRFYAYSSYPVRQFIVGEYIKPRFSFVQAAISSQYHGRGGMVWDSHTAQEPGHTLLVTSVYPDQFSKLFLSTTISPDHVQFTIPRLTNILNTKPDSSLIPYSAYLASHYIFWVMPIGEYKMVMQRCLNDTANVALSNFINNLSPGDSLMNATIDEVLSSNLTGRFSQPDQYLKQFLSDLATSMHSTADVQTVFEQSKARFTAMWAYQVSLLIYHSVKEHLGADNQPDNSSAHQAVNIAGQQLVDHVKHSGNRNISNTILPTNPSNIFQFPFPPPKPTKPTQPSHQPSGNGTNIQTGEPSAFHFDYLDYCVGCYNSYTYHTPTVASPDTCNPSDLSLKGQIGCVNLVPLCNRSDLSLKGQMGCVKLKPLVAPFDPNDKSALSSGPAQVDSSNGIIHVRHYYIPMAHAQDSLRYTIHFENLAAATGAAHMVTITDTLDSHIDPASFHLMNASHDSVLTVQRAGNIVTFTFNGIDLPPDTAAPAGEGFVSYAVKPNMGLTNGTTIKNQASIVFDANPAILTPTTVQVISKTADAALALQSMTDSLVVGKRDTLTVSITNKGPDSADSVHVLMLVPGSITVQGVMGDSSWVQKHDSLIVWMGSVPAMKTVAAKLAIVSHVTGTTTFAAQVYTSSADADIFNDQSLLTEKSVQGTPIERTNSNLPDHYALSQNYPNPFNPTTTIRFALPKAGQVRLEIYNILGQKVATLINKPMRAGFYNVQWDARQVASGLYLYHIVSGHFVKTKKMMLIK